jgi:hypothetical protein
VLLYFKETHAELRAALRTHASMNVIPSKPSSMPGSEPEALSLLLACLSRMQAAVSK